MYNEKQQYKMAICAINFSGTVYCGIGGLLCAEYPFDGSTVIRYYIPENIQMEAYMVFYDSYGNEIKKVEIKETGAGKIEANAQNLAAGIYSYSLIVNGKVVDTKKMMKNK